MTTLKDANNDDVKAGDTIWFSIGTPPKNHLSLVTEKDGKLYATLNSKEINLRALKRQCGKWFKV